MSEATITKYGVQLKSFIKENLNYVGLWVDRDNKLPYQIDEKKYLTTDKDKVKAHKELLMSLEKKEDDRLSIIDTKTSQIVTYAGIIFSAFSLFIPILLDKIAESGFVVRVIFIVVLIFAFIFYVLTIHNAIRNYNIHKFRYSRSHPFNVVKYQDSSVEEFTRVEIRDLLQSYDQNSKTNDEKANNLIYAYRNFRIANILTAILGVTICSSLLFADKKDSSISIKDPIVIQNLDSISTEIIKVIKTMPQDQNEASTTTDSCM